MKSTEIKQDALDDIIKKIENRKSKLTKSQKAESGWEYDKANRGSYAPGVSKSSSTSSKII